jgi:cytochrome b-561
VNILALATSSLGFLEKLTFLESSGVAKYGAEVFLVNFNAIITILFGTFVVLSIYHISSSPSC